MCFVEYLLKIRPNQTKPDQNRQIKQKKLKQLPQKRQQLKQEQQQLQRICHKLQERTTNDTKKIRKTAAKRLKSYNETTVKKTTTTLQQRKQRQHLETGVLTITHAGKHSQYHTDATIVLPVHLIQSIHPFPSPLLAVPLTHQAVQHLAAGICDDSSHRAFGLFHLFSLCLFVLLSFLLRRVLV